MPTTGAVIRGSVAERERCWQRGTNDRGHIVGNGCERSLMWACDLEKQQERGVKEPGRQIERSRARCEELNGQYATVSEIVLDCTGRALLLTFNFGD